MSDILFQMQREIESLRRELDSIRGGEFLTGPNASVRGNLRAEADLQVGSGAVVGNASPTNNPGNGEIWLQQQTAVPALTTSVMKLINVNGALFASGNEGRKFMAIPPLDGSVQMPFTFTRWPTHTNMLLNPTFEVDTAAWTVVGAGSSAARQAGGVWGSYCARVVLAGAGTTHMFYCDPVGANGVTYRVGFYARSISGNTALHSELWGGVGSGNFTLTTSWQWFSYAPTGQGTMGLYFWLGAAGTFEIDGVHMIQTTGDPPYSDPMFGQGTAWSGTAHNSTSYRTVEVMTTSGNVIDHFGKGNKLLILDGGAWKHFYVTNVWYDTYRDLTVIMTYGGSSYALGSNPTTVYQATNESTRSFMQWLDWAPTFTGFSSNPTGNHRFTIHGRSCTIFVRETAGTSNAAGFTMSLPLLPLYVVDMPVRACDNGVIGLDPGLIEFAGGALANIYKTLAGGTWTASGTKYFQLGSLTYEWY